ncbi:MAG: uroporphyrinogen-III synthase [Microthrixaceae bacterium]
MGSSTGRRRRRRRPRSSSTSATPGSTADAVTALLDGRSAPVLAEQLRALGAQVVAVPVYRWELPDDVEPVLRLIDLVIDGGVDAVTFTSSPSIWNLIRLAAEAGRQQPLQAALSGPVRAVCVGPVCASTARASGFARVIEPERARLGAMVHTLGAEASHRSATSVGPRRPVAGRGRRGGRRPGVVARGAGACGARPPGSPAGGGGGQVGVARRDLGR